MSKGHVYIGTSGWNYKHWGGGVFYPPDLPQRLWLPFYCQYFDTVEINNTFYHLPEKKVFENWRKTTPENFLFVVKASRFITHMKKLKEPETSTKRFLENASGLGNKLGPILFQLPPFWNLDLARLEDFLTYLQRQTVVKPFHVAFEIRNVSWQQEQLFELFQLHNISLCLSDWPELEIDSPLTADFVYLRRHGPTYLYSSDYSEEQIEKDAHNIKAWVTEGKDVFVYYNNDAFGFAIKNALQLKRFLSK